MSGPGAGVGGNLPPEDQLLVPPGYGSLRQEDFTLTLRDGSLQLKATPLEEWVIRLAAPDTYRRLEALRTSHEEALDRNAPRDGTFFMVSFFSQDDGRAFYPEDVHLASLGRRYEAETIRPMTAGWGSQLLGSRETQSAVYVFDGSVSFDADLVLEYRGVRNTDWARILPDLMSEQARVRARARTVSLRPVPRSPGRTF